MGKIIRRYNSTIYGNYRKAYLIDGALTGIAMAAIMWLRDALSDVPISTPDNFITEIVMAIGIAWSAYQYRKFLPEQKVTLKELMLLGLGIGLVSSVVYGLWVWFYCGSVEPDMVDFYNSQRIAVMEPEETGAEAKVAIETVKRYTAGDWGFIGGFRSAVMSILFTFFVALVLRSEKSPIRTNNKQK